MSNNSNNGNNNEPNNKKYRSNHAPKGNPTFLDDDNVYNVSLKVSLIKLELKKKELIRKYRETEYHKSGKDKRNPDTEDK